MMMIILEINNFHFGGEKMKIKMKIIHLAILCRGFNFFAALLAFDKISDWIRAESGADLAVATN